MVAQAYNTSYSGGRDYEITVPGQPRQKLHETPHFSQWLDEVATQGSTNGRIVL
jgi:hypothetical protein